MQIRWSLQTLIDWHSMKRIDWSLQTQTDSSWLKPIRWCLLKQTDLHSMMLIGLSLQTLTH